jgi:hypothetical protein
MNFLRWRLGVTLIPLRYLSPQLGWFLRAKEKLGASRI